MFQSEEKPRKAPSFFIAQSPKPELTGVNGGGLIVKPLSKLPLSLTANIPDEIPKNLPPIKILESTDEHFTRDRNKVDRQLMTTHVFKKQNSD